jgi:hypothetical protein
MPRPDKTAGKSPCCKAAITCDETGQFYCKVCYEPVIFSEVIVDENTPMGLSVAEEQLEAVAKWDELRERVSAAGLTCEINAWRILLRRADSEQIVSEFTSLSKFETQMEARGL